VVIYFANSSIVNTDIKFTRSTSPHSSVIKTYFSSDFLRLLIVDAVSWPLNLVHVVPPEKQDRRYYINFHIRGKFPKDTQKKC
jgi:hypothetical protein